MLGQLLMATHRHADDLEAMLSRGGPIRDSNAHRAPIQRRGGGGGGCGSDLYIVEGAKGGALLWRMGVDRRRLARAPSMASDDGTSHVCIGCEMVKRHIVWPRHRRRRGLTRAWRDVQAEPVAWARVLHVALRARERERLVRAVARAVPQPRVEVAVKPALERGRERGSPSWQPLASGKTLASQASRQRDANTPRWDP